MTFNTEQHTFLYNEARTQLNNFPNTWLMEIGSFTGETAKCFAGAISELSPDSRLVCVDPFYGCYDTGLQEVMLRNGLGESSFTAFCKTLGPLLDFVVPIASTREKAESVLLSLPKKFSLVFIDGDHSEEAVHADLELALKLTVPGGIVLCHDADWGTVHSAVNRIVSRYGYDRARFCGNAIDRIVVKT